VAEPRRTQAERREATRAKLIEAGRRLFAERGYAAVSSEELVAAAGVTRGALYHHFEGGKLGLFEAVYEAVEQDLVARFPLERMAGKDPLAAIAVAIGEVLERSREPEIHQIALVDAPAVLGWERWHEIELRYGLGVIIASLSAASEAGQLREGVAVPELANALLGALVEAGHYVARAGDDEEAVAYMRESLVALVEGLAA
jgi:AcrR family transcriptional regulator